MKGKGKVGGVTGSGGRASKRAGFRRGAAGPALVLLGSPMVDATLDDTQGLCAVIETLKKEMGLSKEEEVGEGSVGEGKQGRRIVLKMEVGGEFARR